MLLIKVIFFGYGFMQLKFIICTEMYKFIRYTEKNFGSKFENIKDLWDIVLDGYPLDV